MNRPHPIGITDFAVFSEMGYRGDEKHTDAGRKLRIERLWPQKAESFDIGRHRPTRQ